MPKTNTTHGSDVERSRLEAWEVVTSPKASYPSFNEGVASLSAVDYGSEGRWRASPGGEKGVRKMWQCNHHVRCGFFLRLQLYGPSDYKFFTKGEHTTEICIKKRKNSLFIKNRK